MAVKFTQKAQNALSASLTSAKALGHSYVGSEHLLLGLLADTGTTAGKFLLAHGISCDGVTKKLTEAYGKGIPSTVSASDMTPRLKKIIEHAGVSALEQGRATIGTEHLLDAMLDEFDCMAVRLLSTLGADIPELCADLTALLRATTEKAPGGRVSKSKPGMELAVPNAPLLSQYGRNLRALAAQGRLDPVTGRERETERLIQILSRRTKNNPCLIGAAGVGKTAVVEGLADRIVRGRVPENLRGCVLVALDISSMVAGAKYRGEFEDRLKGILTEVRKNPEVVLFVDELHTIVGAGAAEGAIDAANILKPALARSEVQMIGATTVEEYRRYIEKDPALERRFQPITVDEPDEAGACAILTELRPRYEAHHGLRISDEAIRAAVSLSARYIPDRFLPDKAIDLMDEAASRCRLRAHGENSNLFVLEQQIDAATREKEAAILAQDFELAAILRDKEKALREERRGKDDESCKMPTVEETDIEAVVAQWTGIPIQRGGTGEDEALLTLGERLKERIIGQDEAVDAVVYAIRRGRAGLKDARRPVGSFLFLGRSGVGKTELACALAEVMYRKGSLIRLDMSEYTEPHSVAKLIGAPPGYVGYEDGGRLTEQVRRHPYAVVLFDEIEKAHGDLFSLLLQILEDGRLTDAQGRVVDFKNTVLILTSNLGADRAGGLSPGFGAGSEIHLREREDEAVRQALKRTFRPEFLNRIDETVIFQPLGREALQKIARRLLAETEEKLQRVGIQVQFEDSAVELLISEGTDRDNGARPLRRAIVQRVENPLSDGILSGQIRAGDVVKIVAEGKKIRIRCGEFAF